MNAMVLDCDVLVRAKSRSVGLHAKAGFQNDQQLIEVDEEYGSYFLFRVRTS